MLLLLLSATSASAETLATSAAGNLLLPVAIAFVGGVPVSPLVAVLSSPGSSCFGALLTVPVVVALQGDTTADEAVAGGGLGAGSATVSSDAVLDALTADGTGAGGW